MRSEASYALPLNDVLMVLRASSGQTYQIQADIPASLLFSPMRRGRCHVEVMVAGGQVGTCVIRDQTGEVRLAGTEAFEAVRFLDRLNWIVVSSAPDQGTLAQKLLSSGPLPQRTEMPSMVPQLHPSLVPWAGRPTPVKLQKTPDIVMQLEDRRLRMIWLLIDGQRTVNELATLLQIPLEAVSQALTTLETLGLISSSQP